MLVAVTAAIAPAQQQFAELGQRIPVSGDDTRATTLADVDGDGDLDLLVGNIGCSILSCDGENNRLYLNDGRGNFSDATAQLPSFQDQTNAIAVGDVDGDGDLDVVIGNGYYDEQNRLLINDGSGTFVDATATQLPVSANATQSVALGDVDGDGDLDLICGNGYAGGEQNRLYLNDGLGTFTDVTTAQLPSAAEDTQGVCLLDIDGDGDLDLAIANRSFFFGVSVNRLYINDGQGTFQDVTASHLPPGLYGATAVAAGDVDGDGDQDLVLVDFGNYGPGALAGRLYINDGTGTYTDVTATQMPPLSLWDNSQVELGDIDGDGDLDVVIGQQERYCNACHQVPVLLNDGTGTFTDATGTLQPAGGWSSPSPALGDIDGDGDLDVVIGQGAVCGWLGCSGGQERALVNLLRHLDAPSEPQIGQSYTYDIYARHGAPHAFDVALPYVSLAPAAIALPPFGWVGIDPTQAVALPLVTVPPATGVASFALAIPNNPALAGLSLYAQALHVPYPLPPRLTNVTLGIVQ